MPAAGPYVPEEADEFEQVAGLPWVQVSHEGFDARGDDACGVRESRDMLSGRLGCRHAATMPDRMAIWDQDRRACSARDAWPGITSSRETRQSRPSCISALSIGCVPRRPTGPSSGLRVGGGRRLRTPRSSVSCYPDRTGIIPGMAATRFGEFDDLIGMAAEPLRPVMRRLREIILEIHPDACEVVRLGDRAATYGCGPRKMIEGYAYIMPFRAWVNLGFFRGSGLSDSQGLLEGTGVKMRHVKMRSIEDVERAGVRQLIKDARTERKLALKR